ncbi:hypothetical protein EF910_17895 [Streptomyces sp. WAC07149]|uniref:hypothetical protein n=1 Tax=Streptomyces sp. WAC07149 TaxID=2487425 RepID=UPI000F777801|nr:hypothetical protein [Streptomyces sp. WAC07149]RST04398.1 hypothetical protein EF910_17895 [Streptomyces sp. WAC07149]
MDNEIVRLSTILCDTKKKRAQRPLHGHRVAAKYHWTLPVTREAATGSNPDRRGVVMMSVPASDLRSHGLDWSR